ncbi:MAG: hypothetical protein R6V31_03785, partial [Halohasta sp.]
MRQIRVPASALLPLALLALPAFALFAEDGADTSFDEPGERPDHSELARDFPEPEVPDPHADSDGSATDRAPHADAHGGDRIASTRDVVAEVDGRPVGTLAAPEVPRSTAQGSGVATADVPPLQEIPGAILEQISAGPTGPIGAAVRTTPGGDVAPTLDEAVAADRRVDTSRTPSIDPDPER